MDVRSARIGPWLGGGILLGLVALTLVSAAVRGTAVVGQAVAQPVPAPPEPGHCLLAKMFDDEGGYFVVDSDAVLPASRTGSCAGDRYGEVVWVAPGTDLESSFEDGSWDRCWSEGYRYLGLPDPAGEVGRLPEVNVLTTLTGPDPRQRAVGQDWSACAIQVGAFGVSDAVTVDHSLRDAWSRPEDRRLLAMCLNDGDLQYPVGCREPHRAEKVTSWSGDPAGFGQPDVDACRADAVAALGSAAPLDRGDLVALAQPMQWTEYTGTFLTGPDSVSTDEPYTVTCLLMPADPARTLVGPVRDLGDGPVPLR